MDRNLCRERCLRGNFLYGSSGENLCRAPAEKPFDLQAIHLCYRHAASAIVVRHLVIAFPYPENYTVIFLSASALLFMAAIGFLMIKEDPIEADNTYGMITIIKAIPRMLKSDKNLLNYILQ